VKQNTALQFCQMAVWSVWLPGLTLSVLILCPTQFYQILTLCWVRASLFQPNRELRLEGIWLIDLNGGTSYDEPKALENLVVAEAVESPWFKLDGN